MTKSFQNVFLLLFIFLAACTKADLVMKDLGLASKSSLLLTKDSPNDQGNANPHIIYGTCPKNIVKLQVKFESTPYMDVNESVFKNSDGVETESPTGATAGLTFDTDCSDGKYIIWIWNSKIGSILSGTGISSPQDVRLKGITANGKETAELQLAQGPISEANAFDVNSPLGGSMSIGVCQHMDISLYRNDTSNDKYRVKNSFGHNISVTKMGFSVNSNLVFYFDSTCMSQNTTEVFNIPSGTTRLRVYMKGINPESNRQLQWTNADGLAAPSYTTNVDIASSSVLSKFKYDYNRDEGLMMGDCREYEIYAVDANNRPLINLSANKTVNLSVSAGLSTYASCGADGKTPTTSITSLTFLNSVDYFKRFAVAANSSISDGTVTLTESSTVSNDVMHINPPVLGDHLNIVNPNVVANNSYFEKDCYPFYVDLRDNMNNLMTNNSGVYTIDFRVKGNGVSFYNNPDCTGTQLSNLTDSIPIGQSKIAMSAHSFKITGSAGSGFNLYIDGTQSSPYLKNNNSSMSLGSTIQQGLPTILSQSFPWFALPTYNHNSLTTYVNTAFSDWWMNSATLTPSYSAGPLATYPRSLFVDISSNGAQNRHIHRQTMEFWADSYLRYFDISGFNVSGSSSFTFIAYMSLSPGNDQIIFDPSGGTVGAYTLKYVGATSALSFGSSCTSANNIITDSKWHNIMAVHATGSAGCSIFVDGVQVATSGTSSTVATFSTARVGSWSGTPTTATNLNGQIAEFYLVPNVDLSAAASFVQNYFNARYPLAP